MEAWHKDLIALIVVVLVVATVVSVFTPYESTSNRSNPIIITETPAPHFPESPRPTSKPTTTTTLEPSDIINESNKTQGNSTNMLMETKNKGMEAVSR
jgi:hypothetical protein